MSAPRPDLALRGYLLLTALLAPALQIGAQRRMERAGVPPARRRERLGESGDPRPGGRLVWFHAASVGESLSLLRLLDAMLARNPGLSAVVTSGTATSAEILAARLPARALHQYPPLDTPGPVRGFLDHWRPDLAVFVESEIWPRQIVEADRRGIPLALVNARLSTSSLDRWRRLRRAARNVFGRFRLIAAQDAGTREALSNLLPDGPPVRLIGNLKAVAAAPPADADDVAAWRERLNGRPVWVASSTHPGEDAPVLHAHRQVIHRHQDAMLILAPRHPERGTEIASLARDMGFATVCRTAGGHPDSRTQVYVADTIGEMGLWYRVAPMVFLAGSFGTAGGHNPWEPLAAQAVLLHGPDVPNAREDYRLLDEAGAAVSVTPETLGECLIALIGDDAARASVLNAAGTFRGSGDALVDSLAGDLLDLMNAER